VTIPVALHELISSLPRMKHETLRVESVEKDGDALLVTTKLRPESIAGQKAGGIPMQYCCTFQTDSGLLDIGYAAVTEVTADEIEAATNMLAEYPAEEGLRFFFHGSGPYLLVVTRKFPLKDGCLDCIEDPSAVLLDTFARLPEALQKAFFFLSAKLAIAELQTKKRVLH
jgi:hypothetical protein